MNTTATQMQAGSHRAKVFERLESSVRSYCRGVDAVFEHAHGAELIDERGVRYLDFLAGAGSLNYGHNHPELKQALLEYVAQDGIAHSLDFHTGAKRRFLETLQSLVLKPRSLDYVVQFTGPTGTNAVEAAFKLARKVTEREQIVAFTNGFHGVSLGALAATGNRHHREAAGIAMPGVARFPYAGYLNGDADTLDYLEMALDDPSSGFEHPAAVIVECVQGEGGLNVASREWLQRLAQICAARQILLIVDDIQAGCGRTGSFFSFESAGIKPDMVTLSKSLSGYGLPLAVLLIHSDHDEWQPGEHNGTFRGNNHAFVTATAALKTFWSTPAFARHVQRKAGVLRTRLSEIVQANGDAALSVKGRGLMQGIECRDGDTAAAVCRSAFERGLVIETSGSFDEVVKCLPPLTIDDEQLEQGLAILAASFAAVTQS